MNTKQLTLGSLFSGSGGFELAGKLAGIRTKWNSEVEPFCIAVTKKNFPEVKHYGDVSTLDGAELGPVDIITFGSPCQDMSVAGKRVGLDGERSGLFHEAIRIIKEMRENTNGKYPRYIVWENVPGALSSSGGEDFRAVIEAICKIKDPGVSIPQPSGRWANAGEVLGNRYSLAWRILDARYWGVPQRRKRVYLVADFTGESAGEILFKSEGLSRYSAEGFISWQRTARAVEESTGETSSGEIVLNDQGGNRMDITNEATSTLRAEAHHPPCIMFNNHSNDTRYSEVGSTAPTVLSRYGTGGNTQPFVLEAYGICAKSSNSMKSDNPHSGFYKADTARTVDGNAGNPTCNQGGIAVIEGNGSRPSHRGDGYAISDTMYTLNTIDRHAVAYGIDRAAFNQGKNALYNFSIEEENSPTLVAKGPCAVAQPEEPSYTVRRLTPTECARLQGMPDNWAKDLGNKNPTEADIAFWTDVWETHRRVVSHNKKPKTESQIRKWLADPHSDSAEYKMYGNGLALPCAWFVLAGIAYFANL